MIVRLVLLFLLFFLAYTLVSALLRVLRGGPTPPPTDSNQMVACRQCGTYVPQGELIHKKIGGQHLQFCSEECLQTFKHQQ